MTPIQTLIQETKTLLKKENEVQAQILRNLQKLYDSRIHLKMKFSSFFVFCVNELEMDKSTVWRKLACLALAEYVPDLTDQIEAGQVSATRAQALGGHIIQKKKAGQTPKLEEVKDLFSVVKDCKSEKEVRQILYPAGQGSYQAHPDTQGTFAPSEAELSARLDAGLDGELKALLEEARTLTVRGDRLSQKDILKAALKNYIALKTKERDQALSCESEFEAQDFETPSGQRYISKKLEAFIWYRDKGKCTECGATKNIEWDHIKPYSHFGAHTADNLRLLCRAHNLHFAKENGLVA